MTEQSPPRSVDEIFEDFSARRNGLIRALTTDVDDFYYQCDPEKENLCLYGHSDSNWEVNLPVEEVPPELPEPALGINFARDGMEKRDWLKLVAVHSDAWLLSVAFFYGAKLAKAERDKLFKLINSRATVFETLSGKDSGKPKKPQAKRPAKIATKEARVEEPEDQDSEDAPCPLCLKFYKKNEFWIGCDVCERWYHGACVKVTPNQADGLSHYKCPACAKR
mmetsp:Transcript_20297/g.24267  ORF Transcript_20297/g.24267 Transcript_20297/m.24267 type:complete len:222 (-) Transcript_20297:642-1307(-)|eukprot:CAMPEP_0197847774 /NCGR_PEP_ID=MMETSP1438-20131217/7045_1 /TAXON_ID=1461541 /ORGANISM="Pterosperma sp., Strain CCMP1384" /LENGTH=221 /DNA_ID=CAMNT_0043459793 /DNA_START=190 /DNA_END=855 /DNA_ORIENTATION=+